MSIVDRIQLIMRERGSTLKQLERDCGLGNGTIRRWEEQSPRLDKLEKVADFLQISIDYLVHGSSENATPYNDSSTVVGLALSETEVELIMNFRQLNEHDREDVFTDIKHRRACTFTTPPTAASSTLRNGSGNMMETDDGIATA